MSPVFSVRRSYYYFLTRGRCDPSGGTKVRWALFLECLDGFVGGKGATIQKATALKRWMVINKL